MFAVQQIQKVYPNGYKALDEVSFNIERGEFVMLLGSNGAGKSTLFRCLTGFEKLSEGKILFNDCNVSNMSPKQLRPIRKRIGVVFQNFNLIPNVSVFQNVLFGALGHVRFSVHTLSAFASKSLRKKAMECLDRVGLSQFATRRADCLSGGQKQRVAIARMLMQDPEIILADEPIASLDPKSGTQIMNLLHDISRERGITVLCILHQIDKALEYGDRVLMLQAGKMILDQNVEDTNYQTLERLYSNNALKSQEPKLEGA